MRNMLLVATASMFLAAAPALAQSTGAPPGEGASGQATSDSDGLPWRAGTGHAVASPNFSPNFYDYMARASGAGGSVPFIGEIAGENDRGTAVIGWTGGEGGVTAGSGSSTSSGSQTAADASNGQPLPDTALAKAAAQWDQSTQASQGETSRRQASTGQSRH